MASASKRSKSVHARGARKRSTHSMDRQSFATAGQRKQTKINRKATPSSPRDLRDEENNILLLTLVVSFTRGPCHAHARSVSRPPDAQGGRTGPGHTTPGQTNRSFHQSD